MKHWMFLLSPVLVLFMSKYSVVETADLPSAPITFEADIYPVFQTKCNQGACHGDDGKAFPKYTSYGIIKAKSRKIAYRLKKKKDPMPPLDAAIPLTPEERQLLLDWIASGAPRS